MGAMDSAPVTEIQVKSHCEAMTMTAAFVRDSWSSFGGRERCTFPFPTPIEGIARIRRWCWHESLLR
jgi:hypothetical protein